MYEVLIYAYILVKNYRQYIEIISYVIFFFDSYIPAHKMNSDMLITKRIVGNEF